MRGGCVRQDERAHALGKSANEVLRHHATEGSPYYVDGAQTLGVQEGCQSIRHAVQPRNRRIVWDQDAKVRSDSKSVEESELANSQGPG